MSGHNSLNRNYGRMTGNQHDIQGNDKAAGKKRRQAQPDLFCKPKKEKIRWMVIQRCKATNQMST